MGVRRSEADKYLEKHELERFIAAARGNTSPAVFLCFLLMLNLGLRVGEVVRLTVADISSKGRSLRVQTLKRRHPVTHTLEVPSSLARLLMRQVGRALLARESDAKDRVGARALGRQVSSLGTSEVWLFPSPMDPRRARTVRSLQKAFRKVSNLAGLESSANCHSLRHTRAMLIYEASRDLGLVAHDLRHADRRSAESYVGVNLEAYRRATRSLPVFT